MLQARDALSRRSWSHPQEPTGKEWRADVLADPRARRVARIAPGRGAITIYRLRDEPNTTILVACTNATPRSNWWSSCRRRKRRRSSARAGWSRRHP